MQQNNQINQIKSRITYAVMTARAAGQLGDVDINPMDLQSDPDSWYALVKGDAQAISGLKVVAYGAALGAGATDCSVSMAMPEIIGKDDGKPKGLMTVAFSSSSALPVINNRKEFFEFLRDFSRKNMLFAPAVDEQESQARWHWDGRAIQKDVKSLVECARLSDGYLTFEADTDKGGVNAVIRYVVPSMRDSMRDQ